MTVLLLAVALDLLLGDPPNRFHPVDWIGRLIDLGRRWADRAPPDLLVLCGVFLIVAVTIMTVMGALAAQAATGWLPSADAASTRCGAVARATHSITRRVNFSRASTRLILAAPREPGRIMNRRRHARRFVS